MKEEDARWTLHEWIYFAQLGVVWVVLTINQHLKLDRQTNYFGHRLTLLLNLPAAAKNGICAKHAKIWWVAQLDDPCIKLDFSGDKSPDNRET